MAREVRGVLLELSKPVTLLASMLSILVVLRTAFFGPDVDLEQRMLDSLLMLLLALGVSLISGMVFLESEWKAEKRRQNTPEMASQGSVSRGLGLRIAETFPMQVFGWTTCIMAVLFVIAWWLEAHALFRPNVRF